MPEKISSLLQPSAKAAKAHDGFHSTIDGVCLHGFFKQVLVKRVRDSIQTSEPQYHTTRGTMRKKGTQTVYIQHVHASLSLYIYTYNHAYIYICMYTYVHLFIFIYVNIIHTYIPLPSNQLYTKKHCAYNSSPS